MSCAATVRRRACRRRSSAGLLDVRPDTAKLLVDLGYIPIVKDMSPENRQKVDRDAAERFARTYAAGKHFASFFDRGTPSNVSRMIEKAGIPSLFKRDFPERDFRKVTPLFERSRLRTYLGLERDPDDAPWRQVWKRLAAYLGRNSSSFAVWSSAQTSAFVSTSNKEWPIRIIYDFDVDQPRDIFDDGLTYAVRAELRITGKGQARRCEEIAARAAERKIHPAIKFRHDPDAGTFAADITAVIMNNFSLEFMEPMNSLRRSAPSTRG